MMRQPPLHGCATGLRVEAGITTIPGGNTIDERYLKFRPDLPALGAEMRLDVDDLPFVDLSPAIARWISDQP